MRLLTFQCEEVANILLSGHDYKANERKSREKLDYSADIEQLGGNCPVWCMKAPNKLQVEDTYFGPYFNQFVEEMSLKSAVDLTKFKLIELEVDDTKVKEGITENHFGLAQVIPEIKVKDIVMIYDVSSLTKECHKESGFVAIKLIWLLNKSQTSPLFDNGFEEVSAKVFDEYFGHIIPTADRFRKII